MNKCGKINDRVHDSRIKIAQLLSVDAHEGQCSDDDVLVYWCVGDLHLCRSSIVFEFSIVAAEKKMLFNIIPIQTPVNEKCSISQD